MKVKLIVATDDKFGIGINGKMPWNIPSDLKFFKEQTINHPVIMGRKTFESIVAAGLTRGLHERLNIVITNDVNYASPHALIVHSIDDAIKQAQDALNLSTKLEQPHEDFCTIIGGGTIYEQALNMDIVDEITMTDVHGHYECDTWFPKITPHNWFRSGQFDLVPHPKDNHSASVIKYTRKVR